MDRSRERVVFFDLETGGLNPDRHPIIQFAAVVVDGLWNEIETMEVKLRFDEDAADPEALEKNHYDPEVWAADAIDPRRALDEVAALLRRNSTFAKTSARGKAYSVARLGGQNAKFDCDFLAAWFKRAGEFCPAACWEPLCTLNLARWVSWASGSAPADHKLESLCAWLGIPLDNAHDALADVRATVAVARALSARINSAP